MKKLVLILLICLSLSPLPLSAKEALPVPKKLNADGFGGVFVEFGRVYISAQPNEKSFSKLKEMGIRTVINLRTKWEMSNKREVPFDEQKVVQSLGMHYVHIPLGGPNAPFNKEALNKFAKAFEKASGKVLIHCSSGYRASQMWAAYLIKYKKYPAEVAINEARAANFGEMPIEGLLGKKAIISFK